MKGRTYKYKWLFFTFALFALLGFVPRNKHFPIGDVGNADVALMPFWRSLFPEAYTTIYYKPNQGQAAKIVLWQDIFDGPVALLSGQETNVLLCLYDYDIELRLFRINTSKPFQPLPSNSNLNKILFASTVKIEDGNAADWREVLDYLHNSSKTDFVRQSIPIWARFHQTRESILIRLKSQGIESLTEKR